MNEIQINGVNLILDKTEKEQLINQILSFRSSKNEKNV